MLSPNPDEIVDVFDLDHTLLNTESLWFRPVLDWLETYTGLPRAVIDDRFAECNRRTFTFESLFAALGIPIGQWAEVEHRLRAGLSSRANASLYPFVVQMLTERARVARLVLVTAGDEAWQRWKFDQLTELHPFFRPEDRHFVPLSGSKVARVELYRAAPRISFVDDSPRWLEEVAARVPHVRLIRPVWAGTTAPTDHPGDGRHWDVACSAMETYAILSRD
ncbi:MAG: HAD family hydrolase [Candidatus Uhrbacteria bacterium]